MPELLQILISGFAVGCIYGLVALGFVLIYKATEIVNFAQGDLLMIGAFVAYTFIVIIGFDYISGFILTMLSMAVIGYALDAFVLRRVIGQPQFAIVMLTLGLGFVFRSFALVAWGPETYTMPTPFGAAVVDLGGAIVSAEYIAIICGTAVLCAALYLFFRYTRVGLMMQAASQNQLAAYYVGIPVARIFSLVWAISGAVAAAAGILLAPVSLIETNIGFIGLKAFSAAVIGGFGSIPGAVVGGLILGVTELFASVYLAAELKDVVAYIVLLVVLIVRPQGLFGALARKKV